MKESQEAKKKYCTNYKCSEMWVICARLAIENKQVSEPKRSSMTKWQLTRGTVEALSNVSESSHVGVGSQGTFMRLRCLLWTEVSRWTLVCITILSRCSWFCILLAVEAVKKIYLFNTLQQQENLMKGNICFTLIPALKTVTYFSYKSLRKSDNM